MADVDSSVRRLVALSELRTRLLDERIWTVVLRGMDELGLTPETVSGLTGIDVGGELTAAASRVDALSEELGLVDEADAIASIRNATWLPLTETGRAYVDLELEVGIMADRLLDEVLDDVGAIPDEGVLSRSIRVLAAATTARRAASAELNHYFGAQFSEQANRAEELTALVGQAAIRRRQLTELDRITFVDSQAQRALGAILASDDAGEFETLASDLVQRSIAGGGSEAALVAVLQDLDAVAVAFEASSVTNGLYLDLVDAAGTDIDAASLMAADAAGQRHQLALATLVGLALVSVLVAFAATRSVARPIRRLGAAARGISRGESPPELDEGSGPAEVRDVARAMNEARSHLELAQRQAIALAEGDLAHESLERPTVGSLGDALQSAVRTVADSRHQREEFRQKMTHEATHDGLTQLPNRDASLAQLASGLARSTRLGACLAVLLVDLDGFKEINDTRGHHVGDVVLQAMAGRLRASVRGGDHVGRLGGDEFLVIAEPVRGAAEALELAERIREVMVAPIEIEGTSVVLGASIGVAVSSDESYDEESLLHDADLAVCRAKEQGRDRVEICDQALKSMLSKRAGIEQAVRVGLMEDEFALWYQPIVGSSSQRPAGVEALIRWHRPGHGLVPPDEFIPLAERSGLIIDVDRWVLRNVAKQIVAWDADGHLSDMSISVNISGRSLSSVDFVSWVVRPLEEYGIDPARIVIEVTESAILDDLATAALKLEQLRQRGIRVAIDDFGTGYTSLAHLRSLPVDILKIDRTFTNDESVLSLVQLIIDMGHLLQATITAEGIETREQAALLRQMGADNLQGYYFGRPKPAGEVVSDLMDLMNQVRG